MSLSINVAFEIENPAKLYLSGGRVEVKVGGISIFNSNFYFADPNAVSDNGSFTLYPNFTEPGIVPCSVTVTVYADGREFTDTIGFTIEVNKESIDSKPTTPIADQNDHFYTCQPGESIYHELHWEPSISPVGNTINYMVSPPVGIPFATTSTFRSVRLSAPLTEGTGASYYWSVYAYDSYGNQSDESVSGEIYLSVPVAGVY